MFVQRDLTDSVPTPEGQMHYVKQGSGYPLVMLHPLGTSTWAWHTVPTRSHSSIRTGKWGHRCGGW